MDALFRNTVLFLARFSGFVGMALAFGLPLVDRVVARPALAQTPEASDEGRERTAARFGAILALAAFTTVLAAVAFLLMQWIVNAELVGELGWVSLSPVVRAPYGRWYLVRIAAGVGLIVILARGLRRGEGEGAEVSLRRWWLGLAAVILVTSSLSGHASVGRPLVASIPNDVIHLAAGSLWFAGIVFLRAVLPALWHDRDERDRLRILAPVVTRFSRIALISMIVVGITGTINSLLHIGALDDLVDSSYGIALLSKLVLFAVILGLGGLNHFFLRRRLERAIAGESSGASSRHLLRYTLGIEIAVALGVFIATAVLADLPRTRI